MSAKASLMAHSYARSMSWELDSFYAICIWLITLYTHESATFPTPYQLVVYVCTWVIFGWVYIQGGGADFGIRVGC